MKECEKKSPLRCLNCKKKDCDLKKITMILNNLGLLNGGTSKSRLEELV